MDNLTHTLAGLLMSRAGLDRFCPRAPLILMIAANIPDFEVPLVFYSEEMYLGHHRGASHGLAAAPLLACVPLVIAFLRRRGEFPWRRAWLISLAGVLSHLLLDWTNIYGIRLLAPFSYRWFALEITSVVDAWIWLALIGAALWPLLERLVSAEIGARAKPGRGLAAAALSFLIVYDAGRFVLHQRAVAVQEARLYRGATPSRVAAFPTYGNPFTWRGLVETREFYVMQQVGLLGEFDPAPGRVYYKPLEHPAMEAARRTSPFQVFHQWSRYPLWRLVPLPESGWKAQMTDLRFALPGEERFVATALLDGRLRVARSWYQFDPPGGGARFR